MREHCSELLDVIEPLHRHCQGLDELPALLCQVRGLEERPRGRVDPEKPVVEQPRRGICNRQHFLPRLFHKCLFLGGHSMLQVNRRGAAWVTVSCDQRCAPCEQLPCFGHERSNERCSGHRPRQHHTLTRPQREELDEHGKSQTRHADAQRLFGRQAGLGGEPSQSIEHASGRPSRGRSHANDFLIIGTVFTDKAYALPGAHIRARRASEKKFRWETYTNSRGEFALRIPQGNEYEIVVLAKGFADQNNPVSAKSGISEDTVVYHMQPASGGKK